MYGYFRRNARILVVMSAVLASACGDSDEGSSGDNDAGLPEDDVAAILNDVADTDELRAISGFYVQRRGIRFESLEGESPTAEPLEIETFEREIYYDMASDRLRLQVVSEIAGPASGSVDYAEIIDGDVGFVTGLDGTFLGPGGDARPLIAARVSSTRKQQRLLMPYIYFRDVGEGRRGVELVEIIEQEDGGKQAVIAVDDVASPVAFTIDLATGEVLSAETTEDDVLWGDVVLRVDYSDWQRPAGGGMRFPGRVVMKLDDLPLYEAENSNFSWGIDGDEEKFALPDQEPLPADPEGGRVGELRSQWYQRYLALGVTAFVEANPAVTEVRELEPGLVLLGGATHNSMALKTDIGIVVVEPTVNEDRSLALLASLNEMWPGEPITHIVVTHHHLDHIGGIRTFVAQGADVVVPEQSAAFVREVLDRPHSVFPDALHSNPHDAEILAVGEDGRIVTTGNEIIQLVQVDSIHSGDMTLVHFPRQRSLFNADLHIPELLPAGIPLPASLLTRMMELRDRILELGLDVELLPDAHGGIGTFEELEEAIASGFSTLL